MARCSGCRYGPSTFLRLEIRSAGSISINRAISLFASGGYVKLWLGYRALCTCYASEPLDPLTFFVQYGTAQAHFLTGRHDEAHSWAKMALREQPDSLVSPSKRTACSSDAKCAVARIPSGHDGLEGPSSFQDWADHVCSITAQQTDATSNVTRLHATHS